MRYSRGCVQRAVSFFSGSRRQRVCPKRTMLLFGRAPSCFGRRGREREKKKKVYQKKMPAHTFFPLNVVVVRCDRCCHSSSCTSPCRCFSSCYWSFSCRCSTTCKFPDVLRRSRSSTPQPLQLLPVRATLLVARLLVAPHARSVYYMYSFRPLLLALALPA